MAQRVHLWSLVRHAFFVAGCCVVASLSPVHAQDNKVKAPEWKHGMDLKARKASEAMFEKTTTKYGVEVFNDPNTNKLAYITETGSLAALSGTATGGDKAKEPEFSHGLKLRVRKTGEKDFDEKTKEYGVEVYRDENAGNLVYITEVGTVAVVPIAGSTIPEKVKPPEWRHGLEMPVRKAGENEFTDKTQRYGLEVFIDTNNGNVIYISEKGAIAVIPGAAGLPDRPMKVKNPEWKHAMELKVRDAGAADFNDKTPKIGLEVYNDPNANKLVVISQTGAISVLNGTAGTSMNKDPSWKHGLEMAARKAGQKEFDKTTPKFGIEVYGDDITNSLIYIAQSGAVSAVPMK